MPQDSHETWPDATGGTPRAGAASPAGKGVECSGLGLSSKLLLLTGLFVMLAEVLIFVPSIANFRTTWLLDRLLAARLASLAADAVPDGAVPDGLRMELLDLARVRAVAVKRDDQRSVVLPPDGTVTVDETFDLRPMASGPAASVAGWLRSIRDALAVFVAPPGRTIRIIGQPAAKSKTTPNGFVEIVLPEAPLKSAMIGFAVNVLGLSLIISGITAALVYFALSRMLVAPMMRITRNMLLFSQNPEDQSRIIAPSGRADEIGTAERELAHMQHELAQTLHQKSRLAQLGLAVSKINHDLRNILANAQLLSDRLATLPDPSVQRFAPKLIATLDRAITFCNDTLRFGRAEEAPPRRTLFPLRDLVDEVAAGLMLPRERTGFEAQVPAELRIDADRDHLYRVLNNLVRNAVQAIESVSGSGRGEITVAARRDGGRVVTLIRDNGPGIPEQIQARLFQPFQASGRRGGSGLGLVIAAELVAAHGGTLRLAPSDRGAAFEIVIPDRAEI